MRCTSGNAPPLREIAFSLLHRSSDSGMFRTPISELSPALPDVRPAPQRRVVSFLVPRLSHPPTPPTRPAFDLRVRTDLPDWSTAPNLAARRFGQPHDAPNSVSTGCRAVSTRPPPWPPRPAFLASRNTRCHRARFALRISRRDGRSRESETFRLRRPTVAFSLEAVRHFAQQPDFRFERRVPHAQFVRPALCRLLGGDTFRPRRLRRIHARDFSRVDLNAAEFVFCA